MKRRADRGVPAAIVIPQLREGSPRAPCRLCTTKNSRERDCASATMTDRAKWLTPGNAALTPFADSDLLGLIEPDDLASDQYRMVTGQVLPGDTGVTKPAASGMR
jgi:hypothetical protein